MAWFGVCRRPTGYLTGVCAVVVAVICYFECTDVAAHSGGGLSGCGELGAW